MDRQIVYAGQVLPETTLLQGSKDTMIALGKLAAGVFGTDTLINGFAVTPTAPASLQLNVAGGEIYSLQNVDSTAFSSLDADVTHQIVKQGLALDPTLLTLTAPATAGYAVDYLIQIGYRDADAGAALLPYYNSANPSQPYSGVGNNGQSQNTVRQGLAVVTAKAGAAAVAGSQQTPAPDNGCAGAFVVTVGNGQTQIVASNISAYAAAPWLGGMLSRSGGNMSGAINEALGAAVASAAMPDIWSAGGNTVHLTGNTTITGFSAAPQAGARRTVVFGGALTLTNGSNLILPTGANITTSAGDCCVVLAESTAKFRVVSYTKADGSALAAVTVAYRNLLVNGAMRVAQQYGSALQTPTDSTFVIDQWTIGATQTNKLTFQAQQPGPVALGFDFYSVITSTSAYTAASTDYFVYQQQIEAQNLAALAWGTPNAKSVSLQFVVNSSVAGIFSGSLVNSARNRSYPFSFSIPVAGVDTLITIQNIPGDTAGTWVLSGSGGSLFLRFDIGCGSSNRGMAGAWATGNVMGVTGAVSLVATAGATLKITGVQLEIGSICASFERPTPDAEIARCQRYLPGFSGAGATYPVAVGQCISSTQAGVHIPFKVPTRIPPTGLVVAVPTGSALSNSAGVALSATTISFGSATTVTGLMMVNVASGLGAGNATLYGASSGTYGLFTGAQL